MAGGLLPRIAHVVLPEIFPTTSLKIALGIYPRIPLELPLEIFVRILPIILDEIHPAIPAATYPLNPPEIH